MFIKLTAMGSNGARWPKLVNMDHVVEISPQTGSGDFEKYSHIEMGQDSFSAIETIEEIENLMYHQQKNH